MKRRNFLKGAAAVAATAALPSPAVFGQNRTRALKFVPQGNLTILDPFFTSSTITTNHGYLIYDTLFGITDKQTFTPQMAEGYTTSDDGRTYLIRLREGLKFHNGEPVRAQDCAPSLKRWAAREVVGQTISPYVDNWGVQDDRTIKITMKESLPLFMDLLGVGGSIAQFIMPESIAKTDPFKQITETIGSGPFKFVKDEYVSGSRVAYERNTNYVPRSEKPEWTSGAKIAHFDRIEWNILPDAATASAALQAGEVDWYELVNPDLVPLLRKNPNIKLGTARKSGYDGIMKFNTLYPPMNNPAIRRAIMRAVNQTDYMLSIVGDDTEGMRTCKSMFPCGTEYGRELGASLMTGDIEKAKAELKAAGYNGEKIILLDSTDFPTITPQDNVTFDLFKKLGLNVDMFTSDYGTIVQRRNSKEPLDKGGWSVLLGAVAGSVIATPTGHQFIRGLGATAWPGWFEDAEIEKLIHSWLVSKTPEERNKFADAIQMRAFEMAPMVPTGQFEMRTASRTSITDIIYADGPIFWNVRPA